MAAVIGAMITVAGSVPKYDVRSDLGSCDRGHRLFAYAYLYARPDLRRLEPLVTTVVDREDSDFWAILGYQAIGKLILFKGSGEVSPEIKRRLVDFCSKLPDGSDRSLS
jgi:hypothetical protein